MTPPTAHLDTYPSHLECGPLHTSPPHEHRVLLIDDDDLFRDVVASLLTDLGYNVCPLAGGAEAVDFALKEAPRFILLDQSMPDVEGLTVYDRLLDAGYSNPIIFLSGAHNIQSLVERHGAHYFLKKPFSEQDLTDLLASLESPEANACS